jgi:hypothetical protein
MIDEMEQLDALVAGDAAAIGDAATELPRELVGGVLARTVYAQRQRRSAAWTNWLGWVAAAAALMLAVYVWQLDQRGPGDESARSIPRVEPRHGQDDVYNAQLVKLRSWVHDGAALETLDDAGPQRERGLVAPDARSALTREDAELLDSTALLLELVLESADGTAEDVDRIRRIAEYDDLVPRLRILRPHLDPTERDAVLVAESLLYRIVHGPLDPADFEDVAETVAALALPARLAELSAHWQAI